MSQVLYPLRLQHKICSVQLKKSRVVTAFSNIHYGLSYKTLWILKQPSITLSSSRDPQKIIISTNLLICMHWSRLIKDIGTHQIYLKQTMKNRALNNLYLIKV